MSQSYHVQLQHESVMDRSKLFRVPYCDDRLSPTAYQYVPSLFPATIPCHPHSRLVQSRFFLLSWLSCFFFGEPPLFLGWAFGSCTTTYLLLSGHYRNSAVGIWLPGRQLEGLSGAQVPAASPLLTLSR